MPTNIQSENILPLIGGIWGLLANSRKRQFKLLIMAMIMSSMLELISIGALIPFLNSITSPDEIYRKFIEPNFLRQFIAPQKSEIVFWMAILFSMVAAVSACMKILVIWGVAKVSFAAGADISLMLYKQTISQPYSYYLTIKSNEVIDVLSAKVHSLINSVFMPILYLINAFVMAFVIVAGLIFIDYRVALGLFVIYGALYYFVLSVTKSKLHHNSQLISISSPKLIQLTQMAIGGIRDIIIDGARSFFIEKFAKLNTSLRTSQSNSVFIANSPKSILEALGLILVSAVVIIKSKNNTDLVPLIGILGVLVLASQKLLPLMQSAYASISSLRENKYSILDVLGFLFVEQNPESNQSKVKFEDYIEFSNLTFAYQGRSTPVLNSLNLKIIKGSKVGFIGKTGSGKSTLVDLLMGLLKPSIGEILIDGLDKNIYNNLNWFEKIAHVPQSIYILDGTIEENIAFGVPSSLVDQKRLYKAAMVSQVDEFVSSLKDGYQSLVGESGSSLSGGQRQRIGIARALYKNAPILILDEATSALDSGTERLIMDRLHKEYQNITIISIAHRKEVLIGYDQIIELGLH